MGVKPHWSKIVINVFTFFAIQNRRESPLATVAVILCDVTTSPNSPVVSDLNSERIPPTRTRFIVLTFVCLLAFVLYLDRICISKAAPSITKELKLSDSEMGFVFSAFTLAYCLFEIPTGHWADRIGSRRVLTRISIWWSIFTALTGACGNLWSLLIVRFLFGAGEAGCYPNAARIFARWFPVQERGRAQGLLNFAASVGGAAAPVVAVYLIALVGWRWSFVIFGSTGVFWAAFFVTWFRDSPADHPSVNAAELALINPNASQEQQHPPIPWGVVLTSQCILLLGVIMTCASFNSYIYFTWFPTYLEKGREVTPQLTGWLAALVLAGAALGNLSGGFVNDFITKYCRDVIRARQILGSTAYTAAAVFLVAALQCESAKWTSILLAASIFSAQSTSSAWWSCAIEVSGRHIGALFGLMNGMGVAGAMGSPMFFGVFADWRKREGYLGRDQWDPAFYVVAGVLLLAAVCWHFVNSSQSVDPEEK